VALLSTTRAASNTGHIADTNQAHKKLNGICYDVKADFGAVGDGTTNDRTAINDAITAANSAGGGVVMIPPSTGAYMFSCAAGGSGIIMKSNVTLLGTGGVLKLMPNQCTSGASIYYPIDMQGVTNAHLRDLRIDGNRTGGNTSYLVADGITLSGQYLSIRGCYITAPPDSAIMFSDCIDSMVCDNYIRDWFDIGVYINGDTMTRWECSRNRLEGTGRDSGIAIKRGAQRGVISANTVYNCGNGITMEEGDGPTDWSLNLMIVDNFIHNIINVGGYSAPNIGILVRAADYVVVANNRLENIGGVAINLQAARYCSVTGNVVQDPDVGIMVEDRSGVTTHATEECVIANNVIRSPAAEGIYMLSGSATNNERNILTGNTFTGGTYGIRITADNNATNVTNNICQGSTSAISNSGTNGHSSGNRNVGAGTWV
jgi:nitrous oxidase accessory protein NosD